MLFEVATLRRRISDRATAHANRSRGRRMKRPEIEPLEGRALMAHLVIQTSGMVGSAVTAGGMTSNTTGGFSFPNFQGTLATVTKPGAFSSSTASAELNYGPTTSPSNGTYVELASSLVNSAASITGGDINLNTFTPSSGGSSPWVSVSVQPDPGEVVGTMANVTLDAIYGSSNSGNHLVSNTYVVEYRDATGTSHTLLGGSDDAGTPAEQTATIPIAIGSTFSIGMSFSTGFKALSGFFASVKLKMSAQAVQAPQPPVAVNHEYSTPANTPLFVPQSQGVLAGATDPAGLPMSASIVHPIPGLNLNADGSFSYTPPAGFVGTESFLYAVSDGHATSQPATVTINVLPVPPPPPSDEAPGDFDAVGQSELTVFRPSTAQWIILDPTTGATRTVSFGATGLYDIPAPGDYDKVGRTELAVFRPSTAQWIILDPTTGATRTVNYGGPNYYDLPVETSIGSLVALTAMNASAQVRAAGLAVAAATPAGPGARSGASSPTAAGLAVATATRAGSGASSSVARPSAGSSMNPGTSPLASRVRISTPQRRRGGWLGSRSDPGPNPRG
jgi:hypothetical protein